MASAYKSLNWLIAYLWTLSGLQRQSAFPTNIDGIYLFGLYELVTDRDDCCVQAPHYLGACFKQNCYIERTDAG